MDGNKTKMIELFVRVRALGFVKSHRRHNTGIGKRFEDCVGVVGNNRDEPDLLGYEIKSHRDESSYISLFAKAPVFPRRANTYLRDRFGVPYEENPGLKRLHASMFASRYNSFEGLYSFRLLHDAANRVIRIGVYDLHTKRLLDSSAGYTYDCLERILQRKLKDLFYVGAERKYENGTELFRFNRADIYSKPSLERVG